MVKLFTDLAMLDHQPRAGHPERPERLQMVLRHLKRTGLDTQCLQGVCRTATDDELLRVHTPEHLRRMAELAQAGGGQAEADTWLSPRSEIVARLAAGSVVAAIDGVLTTADRQAICLVRPPGHHARPDGAMGFCVYGSVAVGAADAVSRMGLDRILIVDWDVHHGNGTQEIFYTSEQVGFFSIHRNHFYPGTGAADETGTGAGLGTTLNVPIDFGTSRQVFIERFQSNLAKLADRLKPQLILLSAGFDAHGEDPVGNLGLETEDYLQLTQTVVEIARQHAGGRIVSVLEGGYNPSRLADCVAEHLRLLIDQKSNDPGGI